MNKNELYHYGVLGMKWGVRRYQPYSVKPRKSGKGGKEIGLANKNGDFKETVNDIKNNLSSDPKEFVRKDANFYKVKRRGNLSDDEAMKCIEIGNKIFEKASRIEPRITNDISSVIKDQKQCSMYGLENRLKQPESIAAKIGSDAKIENVPFEKAGSRLNDVIRYTAVSDTNNFVDNYNGIVKELQGRGYSEIKCKNYYDLYSQGKVMHKALQSTFRDNKTGMTFELQYHTPESQAAKELKVPLYEEARLVKTSEDRKRELEREMIFLAEQVPNPRNIDKIKAK